MGAAYHRSRRGIPVALCLVVFTCLGWTDTWDSIRKAAAAVSSIQAGFVQTKHMRILARPLTSEGVFLFKAPASLRWEYRRPVQSILLSHNGTTRRFIKRDQVITEDAAAGLPSMQFVLQEITRWLNGRFDENPAFAAALKPGRRIELTPKTRSLADIIERIELVLSEQPGIIQSVTIYEGKDSYTRLDFIDVILNQPLKDSFFQKVS